MRGWKFFFFVKWVVLLFTSYKKFSQITVLVIDDFIFYPDPETEMKFTLAAFQKSLKFIFVKTANYIINTFFDTIEIQF